MSEPTFLLELNETHLNVLKRACEFYSRVLLGQFDEIAFETMLHNIKQHDFCERRERMEQLLHEARQCAFPELKSRGHSHGIGYDRTADIAWNIYQAVRYTEAMHAHPEGGTTVDYNRPMDFGGVGLPICKVKEEKLNG